MLRTKRGPLLLVALAAALALTVVTADARSKGSMGSRGSHTYSAPPSTATTPNTARPMDRTMTQPTQARPNTPATAGQASPAARPGGMFGGMFGGGLLGGLAAGFLGAGLFGMLTGSGFMGGMGGFASMLGLLLQIGLVVVIGMLLYRWWQRRNGVEPATAGGPSLRQGLHGNGQDQQPSPMLGGLFGGSSAQSAPPPGQPIELKPEDFNAFEKLLGEVQTAYGKEDLNALRSRVTPEMLSYYSDELAHNASNGDVNQISDIKLLQGDLSEAWQEGNDEYATVAMRYSLNDRIVARDDGRLIEQQPSEATELWTFRRARGGQWMLSAVQQTE
jgi:predicted lipid-binding transport protein (Tim44 family)